MARGLIIAGILMVVSGILFHFVPGLFNWFGRLPGDIRIEKGKGFVFIPISSMIVVSFILTLVINLIRRFMA